MRVSMRIPVAADVASRLLVLAGVAALATGLILPSATIGTRLAAVVLIGTVAGLASSALVYTAAMRIIRVRPLAYERDLLISMARDALPLAAVLVIGMVHYRIDVLILTAMKGTVAVGQYGVATKLLDVSLAISAMFISVAFPVLSARLHGDAALLRRAVQKALEFMLILGLGVGVFACVLAPEVVQLVGGSLFTGAVLPLAVIAWAVPVMFANQVFSNVVVAANRQTAAVPIVLAATGVNIVLNVLLIPSMGAVGPALVTDISETVSALGIGILMVRTLGFVPSPGGPARILISAGAAGAVLLVTRPLGLIPAAGAGAAVYGAALLLTRAVSPGDVTALLRKEIRA
jgi:O-antigen/teichoic acid export membrane protein